MIMIYIEKQNDLLRYEIYNCHLIFSMVSVHKSKEIFVATAIG